MEVNGDQQMSGYQHLLHRRTTSKYSFLGELSILKAVLETSLNVL